MISDRVGQKLVVTLNLYIQIEILYYTAKIERHAHVRARTHTPAREFLQ